METSGHIDNFDNQNRYASASWVKLYRKLLHSPTYQNLNSRQRDVFINLLLMANYQEKEWTWEGEKYTCKPGQFVTSLESIKNHCAKEVKIQSVRSALLALAKSGFLTNRSTKRGRLITICKWATYQGKSDIPNKVPNNAPNKETTTTKERKNLYKEKGHFSNSLKSDLQDRLSYSIDEKYSSK